ncbi:helix-turn-helix domain-containing protein [Thalassospira sp. CH_XMU1420-2]|uniref:helix-turn-helix domain-containing protein n=1 Tax=Thalassospira sp. CH_XMU1420-2 TaxID=3107769 RepID=UPI003007F616|tara:strand:+ start:14459 stop:14863 length:405 start_codon:yes stop_codon:yes gene_type:complete
MSSIDPEAIDGIIGGKVRSRRTALGLTLDEMSDRLGPDIGLKRGAIKKLESGSTRWRFGLLVQFAEALDISFLELIPEHLVDAAVTSDGPRSASLSQAQRIATRIEQLSPNSVKAIVMLLEHFETVEDATTDNE